MIKLNKIIFRDLVIFLTSLWTSLYLIDFFFNNLASTYLPTPWFLIILIISIVLYILRF